MKSSVKPWTILLEEGVDFWEPLASVVDEIDGPITYIDTELTIFPPTGDPIVWNPTNGYLTIVEAGRFAFNVPKEVISTYNFESADYKWSVTYTNGKVDGQWMEGKVRKS